MSGRKYRINEGPRDQAIRLGCERGLYDFFSDYARDMGMSRSAALRRLALIGARCEKEHGHSPMPMSYENLTPATFSADDVPTPLDSLLAKDKEFDWGEE